MSAVLRNVLAIIAGVVMGGVVNMLLITAGASLIPAPAGVDVNNAESLSKGIHLFEARHYVTPFLAHAVGTFAGALAAYLIAATYRAQMALLIGAIFLCGGVAASLLIPAPAWFMALDLLVAYLPMAWLAIQVARKKQGNSGALGRT